MSQGTNNESIILIDYYNGAYGPTIRIDIQSQSCLDLARSWFHSLSEEKISELKIHELDYVRITGLKGFTLRISADSNRMQKSLTLSGSSPEDFICQWENSPDNWKLCLELISGTDAPPRWHQYLGEEGTDDALIELAFMETGREQDAC